MIQDLLAVLQVVSSGMGSIAEATGVIGLPIGSVAKMKAGGSVKMTAIFSVNFGT
jgi:hypothetical protein